MARVESVAAERLLIPLGQARGGSGATQLELVLVSLQLKDGPRGVGFTYTLGGGGAAVLALLKQELLDPLMGLDLRDFDHLLQQYWAKTHRLGAGVSALAISAIDIAVWDARACEAGVPLYRLLGAERNRIEVYGSGRATNTMTIEELIEGARQYLAEGCRAIKLRVGTRPPAEDLARVRAVREAVGDDVRIMVDCNERLDLPTALWLGERLGELGVYWLEEPLPSYYVEQYAELSRRLPIAIAAGEHLQTRYAFAEYLRQRAASVLMPDAPIVGGITEWLRVAAVAEAFGVPVSPHFLPELHIHCALAVPNCREVEHFPLLDQVLENPLPIQDGRMSPWERPGHGMVFGDERLERFRVRE